jgi:hypothetical protein
VDLLLIIYSRFRNALLSPHLLDHRRRKDILEIRRLLPSYPRFFLRMAKSNMPINDGNARVIEEGQEIL